MENLSNLETMDQIKKKLRRMEYEDFVELLSIYQCTVGELPMEIAKAKGLKDSQVAAGKKKGEMDFQHVQLCRLIYLQGKFLEETIKSARVIEGVLKDINMALDRIGDGLVKQ